jgi:hypothetical protein
MIVKPTGTAVCRDPHLGDLFAGVGDQAERD